MLEDSHLLFQEIFTTHFLKISLFWHHSRHFPRFIYSSHHHEVTFPILIFKMREQKLRPRVVTQGNS